MIFKSIFCAAMLILPSATFVTAQPICPVNTADGAAPSDKTGNAEAEQCVSRNGVKDNELTPGEVSISGTDLGSGRISSGDLGSGRISGGDLGSGRVKK